MTTPGYPPPDEEIGQQFLDQLRADLDRSGAYGTHEWRVARDAQLHRLHSLGWDIRDLVEHYRITRPAVLAALSRVEGNPNPTRSYAIQFQATSEELAKVRATLDKCGIAHAVKGTDQ